MTALEKPLTFVPPGPGPWQRLADHFPRALTAEYQRLYAETCPPGMAKFMERYGVLVRTLDAAYIHGHLYVSPVPLVGSRQPRSAPPRSVVWLMARIIPVFRRRNRSARRTLAERPWRAVAEQWFDVEREQWCTRARTLETIAPESLSETALAEHLRACRALVVAGYLRHFELHGDDLLPLGLLIARCAEWGVGPAEATSMLAGSATAPHASEVSPWMLVTGYDLDCLTWGELHAPVTMEKPTATAATGSPHRFAMLSTASDSTIPTHRAATGSPHRFAMLSTASDSTIPTHRAATSAPIDVAAEHREELASLIADARTAARLRDDNGAITGAWPMGLLRRAMLAVGRRHLAGDPHLAVEATVDELLSVLAGDPAVSEEDLRRRRSIRHANSALDAPLRLGPELALPPLDALPGPLGLIAAAQLAVAEHTFTGETAVGIGTVAYTGRALVIDDPLVAIELIEPGDVIVTTSTSPAWNTILTQVGALVTTNGGLASHAAVTARELGIPAVIGDRTACQRLRTGLVVTVNPSRATVTIEAATEPSRRDPAGGSRSRVLN